MRYKPTLACMERTEALWIWIPAPEYYRSMVAVGNAEVPPTCWRHSHALLCAQFTSIELYCISKIKREPWPLVPCFHIITRSINCIIQLGLSLCGPQAGFRCWRSQLYSLHAQERVFPVWERHLGTYVSEEMQSQVVVRLSLLRVSACATNLLKKDRTVGLLTPSFIFIISTIKLNKYYF